MPELDIKKSKTLSAPVIKVKDLPDDLKKAADGLDIDQWFYATVEIEDREKDIIRVDGINLTSYAHSGPIKFISAHNSRPLADGRLPVVGKAVKWVKCVHKSANAPALAVGIKFAPTELGNEMKRLYAEEFLTDVSVGLEPIKATPKQGGGYDYTETAMGELSACINGMNQLAGVMRAYDKEMKLDNGDRFAALLDRVDSKLDKALTRLDDIEDSIEARAQKKPGSAPAELPGGAKKSQADTLAAIKSLMAQH